MIVLFAVFDNLLMHPPTIYTMASAGSKTCVCKLCTAIVHSFVLETNNSTSCISQVISLIIIIGLIIGIGYFICLYPSMICFLPPSSILLHSLCGLSSWSSPSSSISTSKKPLSVWRPLFSSSMFLLHTSALTILFLMSLFSPPFIISFF